MFQKIKQHSYEIIGSITCVLLGMISGYSVKASSSIWYNHLNKPIFNPPSWIFAPVWTILYIMMGIACGILFKDRIKNKYLITIFVLQMLLNLVWSPIFFYYENITLALIDLLSLWILIVLFIYNARNQKSIILLIIPYFLWVSFAGILNFMIYQLNVVF